MLVEVVVYLLPERIQEEFDAFPSGDFGGGHEVAVSGDEDDGIDLLLEREGGDVDADAHVHALLPKAELQVIRCKALPRRGDRSETGDLFGC